MASLLLLLLDDEADDDDDELLLLLDDAVELPCVGIRKALALGGNGELTACHKRTQPVEKLNKKP